MQPFSAEVNGAGQCEFRHRVYSVSDTVYSATGLLSNPFVYDFHSFSIFEIYAVHLREVVLFNYTDVTFLYGVTSLQPESVCQAQVSTFVKLHVQLFKAVSSQSVVRGQTECVQHF